MNISEKTAAVLEDIERRIDPETEEDFVKQWEDFLYDRFDGDVFTPQRKNPKPFNHNNEFININDAVDDYDIMLRSELIKASKALASKDSSVAIRANLTQLEKREKAITIVCTSDDVVFRKSITKREFYL